MTFPGGGGLGDIFGSSPGPAGPKKEEKGVPWRAKVIDGMFYIPLEQVAELLEANNVLPKVSAGVRRRVEKGPDK